MGEVRSKNLNEDDRASQSNVRPPSDDAELIFLVEFEKDKLSERPGSELPGPAAQRFTEKQQSTQSSKSPVPCNVHAGNAQTESTNQLVWVSYVAQRDNIPSGGKIYIVRKMKLADSRLQSTINKIPEPKKVFIVKHTQSKKLEEVTDFGQTDCFMKSTNLLAQVFDTIRARLVESNRMVNLHMLKAFGTIIPQMKENLPKVVCLLIPAIVDNHLNSKISAIYRTALAAIHSLVHNLGMVMELYPRRPKKVEQQVLPLLWHMLDICSRSAATVALFRALYSHMGHRLWESAVCQPLGIRKGLHHLLSSA